MTITPADLRAPIGDLDLDYFPGKSSADLDALLGAYIADASARLPVELVDPTAIDLAVTAWSYYRAYRNIAMRLSRDPASVSVVGEVATVLTGEQIRTFKAEAERWLGEWATFSAPAITSGEPGGSVAVPNVYVF